MPKKPNTRKKSIANNHNTDNDLATCKAMILAQDKVIKLYQHYTIAPLTSTKRLLEAAETELIKHKNAYDSME